MKRFYSLFIVLLLSLVITSCSKKDDKNVNDPEEPPPGIPTVAFKGPNTTSTDPMALATKGIVESMNAYPMMFSVFASTKPTSSDGQWKWVLNVGPGATETFSASKNSQGGYTWKFVLNGTIDDVTYNNWKLLEGTTSADGKSGNWKIYDDNSTTLLAEYNWSTNSAGVLSGTMLGYDNAIVTEKLEITNNPDNSGSLLSYKNGQLDFKSTWTATGTGQWWSYENGVVKTQGNWQ